MGSKDLHTKFICRDQHEKKDGKRQHNIGDITDKIVGIDVSTLIHGCMRTKNGSEVFDMKPEVPLHHALSSLIKNLKNLSTVLKRGGNEIVLFFDGESHPMKAETEERRKQLSQKHLEKLTAIYNLETVGTYETVQNLRKEIVYRREDFTAMVKEECVKLGISIVTCAPYEADFQLVEAQQQKLIDIIISNDGDLFVLGGDNIVTDLDYYTGSCCIYKRSDILSRDTMGGGRWNSETAALSCLLGNDHLGRLHGNGPVAVTKLMDLWVTGDDNERKSMIDTLEITKHWKRGDTENAKGYAAKFWAAYNLLKYAPVFRLIATSEDVEIDLGNKSTYIVFLAPLNPLPSEETTDDQWGEMIGFRCNPSSLLRGSPGQLFHLDIMPKTGQPPQLLPQPVSEYEPRYQVAHGAIADTNIPLPFWSDWALRTFLCERGLRLRGPYNRGNSLRLAKRVLNLMQELGHRAPQPREWKPNQRTAYDEEEPLGVSQDNGSFVWDTSWEEFTDILQDIDTLNDQDFFESFGRGRNGIQTRAQRLITGGHFNVAKIQTAKCNVKSSQHEAVAMRMECVPSMKSDPYWVMSVYDLVTKKFIPAPVSRCGCPAGLGGCSHLRAEYAIFSQIQKVLKETMSSDAAVLTQEEASCLFAPSMQNMRGMILPWEYVFHDDDVDRDLKKLKRMKENEYRRKSNLNSILLDLNSGNHVPDDDDDDDNDDDSYKYCSSDDDSVYNSEGEWDEEEIINMINDDDDDMVTSDDINNVIDLETATESGRDIKLCDFVHKSVNKAALRAKVLQGGTETDYKMERAKVFDHLRGLLDGNGGPNESIQSKLDQLEQQEALHYEFHVSKTIEKCLLSHYLHHTRMQRLVSIEQLKYALSMQQTKADLNWVPERLAKLPKGNDGLGDRGFAGTSPSYPNCNQMKTPCFMDGREQFTCAEVIGSRDLCQGRYGSEAYNKRTNDQKYIQDKIPRRNFVHVQDVLKWSMFHANLCQPFLMPRGAGDYFPKDTLHLKRPSKKKRADLSILSQPIASPDDMELNNGPHPSNYIDIAMPERYFQVGLDKVGLLMDGKDCVTDTVRVNSFISRALYSDKMHCSAARYIMWVLPSGLGVTYTPLCLGRSSEKALVEYWGGSTYDFLS